MTPALGPRAPAPGVAQGAGARASCLRRLASAGYLGSALGLVLGTLRLPLIVLASGSPLAAAGTNIAISAAAAASGASATSVRAASTGASSPGWRRRRWSARSSARSFADDVSEALLYGIIAAVLFWSGSTSRSGRSEPRTRDRPRSSRGRSSAS